MTLQLKGLRADYSYSGMPKPRWRQIYPVYATTRNCLGSMTRKLSVTALRNSRHLLGTSSRKKPSVASAKAL